MPPKAARRTIFFSSLFRLPEFGESPIKLASLAVRYLQNNNLDEGHIRAQKEKAVRAQAIHRFRI